MEYIIAGVLILFTLLIYKFFRKEPNTQESNLNTDKSNKKINSKPLQNDANKSGTSALSHLDYQDKIVDGKSIMINSFKEGKILNQPSITGDGKTILFHDSKRIFLCNITSFSEKNPKFLSKTIEQDVICDASYSSEKKYLFKFIIE
jgi:hypothetical protein